MCHRKRPVLEGQRAAEARRQAWYIPLTFLKLARGGLQPSPLAKYLQPCHNPRSATASLCRCVFWGPVERRLGVEGPGERHRASWPSNSRDMLSSRAGAAVGPGAHPVTPTSLQAAVGLPAVLVRPAASSSRHLGRYGGPHSSSAVGTHVAELPLGLKPAIPPLPAAAHEPATQRAQRAPAARHPKQPGLTPPPLTRPRVASSAVRSHGGQCG